MREVLEDVKEWLEILENSISLDESAPSDFEKTFCDGNELLEVAFSSHSVIVWYMLSDGGTMMNSFTLQQFNDWLDKEE